MSSRLGSNGFGKRQHNCRYLIGNILSLLFAIGIVFDELTISSTLEKTNNLEK
jgi:hypothetical protein